MKKHYRKENDCLNCGAELQGHFCHICGQENLEIKENFGHLMGRAISDYFHFDEKFFNTLKPLLFKPGKLTIDYMEGKRTRYLHPIRIYIFISLVFFLLYFSGGETKKVEHKKVSKAQELDAAKKTINQDDDLTANEKKVALANVDKYTKGKIENGDTTYSIGGLASITEKGKPDKDTTYDMYLLSQQKLAAADRDNWLNRLYHKKKFEWKSKGLKPNEAISEGFKHNFPKLMFLLLPLFAFLIRIAFWKNHKFYVEHLIYAFHLHCFIFLFLTLVMLLKMALPADWSAVVIWINFLSAFAILLYIYHSLRVLYQRSRWRTVSKMIGVSLMYSLTSGICALIFLIFVAFFS
jgi:hypothetical protein